MASFDPYQIWLDIPVSQRPVSHYRLFSLRLDESNPGVIADAADRTIARIEGNLGGPHDEQCRALLAALRKARAILLDPRSKQDYDHQLSLGSQVNAEKPLPSPPNPAFSQGRSIAHQEVQIPHQPPSATGPEIPTIPAAPAPHSPSFPGESRVNSPPTPATGNVPTALDLPSSQKSGVPNTPPVAPTATPLASVPMTTVDPIQPTATSIPFAGYEMPLSPQNQAYPVMPPSPAMPPPRSTPPPPTASQESRERERRERDSSWIPHGRTGRVGKAVANALESEQAKRTDVKTARAQSLRRRHRRSSSFVVTTIALVSVLLLLTAFLILIISMQN